MGSVFCILGVGIVLIVGLAGLRGAKQFEHGVMFRLGMMQGRRGPGLYWLMLLARPLRRPNDQASRNRRAVREACLVQAIRTRSAPAA